MKYLAFTLPELELLHGDVPFGDVVFHEGENESDEITCTLKRALAYRRVRVEGANRDVPLIRKRGTLIVADDGNRQQGFIVEKEDELETSQDALGITGVGHSWVLKDHPWDTDKYDGVKVDPLDIVRRIFAYVTSYPDSINIEVDDTESTVLVGEEERNVEFTTGAGEDVSFDAGPYRLNPWSTEDLYKEFQDLASETPFEWAEETVMSRDSDAPPRFRLRLGWPRLTPIVRDDHLFQIGINVTESQQPEEDDFFTHVIVFGNGDGPTKKRGEAARKPTGRQRKYKTVTDQGLKTNGRCKALAQDIVDRADRESRFIAKCRVMDHDAAPVGTFGVGDVIFLQGQTVWDPDHLQKCRIVQMDRRMSDNSVALTLVRWE